jgi:hypothetical protein
MDTTGVNIYSGESSLALCSLLNYRLKCQLSSARPKLKWVVGFTEHYKAS